MDSVVSVGARNCRSYIAQAALNGILKICTHKQSLEQSMQLQKVVKQMLVA